MAVTVVGSLRWATEPVRTHVDLMDRAVSRGGVPIRLTEERWFHIVENHDDLAGYYDEVLDTVENPDMIIQGDEGALVAAKRMAPRRHLAVVYKELTADDGFVVTAYFTRRLARRTVLWRRQQHAGQ